MGWDDDDNDDWEKSVEKVGEKLDQAKVKKSDWSDEEEEEEETVDITRLREEKEALLKKLEEINAKLPVETPKESSKKGKQQKKLLKEKEDAERAAALEKAKADAQVSTQRKIEESDFENAQDMFGGSTAAGASDGKGKFETWVLNSMTKLPEVEAFAKHVAEKIAPFEKEFLYISLIRVLLQETTKNIDVLQTKDLLLVLTKGKDGFNVVDLIRNLLRDADKDISPEDIAKELAKESKKDAAKDVKGKSKELAKLTSRQELIKLILHDLVKEVGSEVVARIISEGCGVVLTKDQEKQVHKKRQDLTNDPNVKKEPKAVRPSDHKSMEMYDAFGAGGGEGWGGGGGTRGDDYDFM